MQDYTTGRAARELGISQSVLRGLCQAGLVAARSSAGGHWRIAKQEVARLKRDGIPELPPSQPLEDLGTTGVAMPPPPARHPGLLSDPSPDAISAADEAVRLENEVKALGFKRSKAEAQDWFRARRAQRAEAATRHAKQRIETRAERLRERWESAWIELAFAEYVPKDCPQNIESEVLDRLREALGELDLGSPRSVVVRLVQSAVDTALSTWRRRQQIDGIIREEVKSGLPLAAQGWTRAPSDWDLQASRKAFDAVSLLNADAAFFQVREVARSAVREVRAEFEREKAATEHDNLIERVLASVVHGEDARKAVRIALERLAVGCGYSEMQKVRDTALAPFVAATNAALEAERAALEADRYLGHVHTYIEDLGKHREWNLVDAFKRLELAEKLKPRVRAQLAKAFLRNKFEPDDDLDTQVKDFIEECVDDEILK